MKWLTRNKNFNRKELRQLEARYKHDPEGQARLKRAEDGTATEQDMKQLDRDKVRVR